MYFFASLRKNSVLHIVPKSLRRSVKGRTLGFSLWIEGERDWCAELPEALSAAWFPSRHHRGEATSLAHRAFSFLPLFTAMYFSLTLDSKLSSM